MGSGPSQEAPTIGSCATGTSEPCQVLTEAALRKPSCVPQGCLVRAEWTVPARAEKIDDRCTVYIRFRRSQHIGAVTFFIRQTAPRGGTSASLFAISMLSREVAGHTDRFT